MKRLVPIAVACVVVLFVYVPVLGHGFVWDDNGVVIGQRSVMALDWLGMVRLGLWDDLENVTGTTPYYRQMLVLSFGFEKLVSGSAPWFVHHHSLLWHLANVGLLTRLLAPRGGFWAVGIACLVGLHPTIIDAVAFAAARNDLMVTTFLLLSLAAVRDGKWTWTALFGALAMASKESAVVLPAVLAMTAGGVWRGVRAQRVPTSTDA